MNDFVLTQKLITQQEKKINLFNHVEHDFFTLLKEVGGRVDAVIKRLQIFLERSSKNKHYLVFGGAIHEEYQEAKREWNLYVKKIYSILKNIARGNTILEDEAQQLYMNLSL